MRGLVLVLVSGYHACMHTRTPLALHVGGAASESSRY